MKYRDLKLMFTIENVQFSILSICLEKLVNPIPRHNHSRNSYELHYISYGYGTMIASDKEYKIMPGTLVMTGPGVEHEQISLISDPMTEYCVYLQVENSDKKTHSSLIDTFLNCLFWIDQADNNVHNLMKQIFSELEKMTAGYKIMLQTLLQQLIILVIRHYQSNNDTCGDEHSERINPSDLTYLVIEEAFLYDFRTMTLEKLAYLVNLGVRQTERLLLKHYNKTFQQKKTEARLSASCILLRETGKSISAIAEDLGYSSSEHFTNAFKHFYHATPSSFRTAQQRYL